MNRNFGVVNLAQNSHYRVAFDLMMRIADREEDLKLGQENPREYFLTLYKHCKNIVYQDYTVGETLKVWREANS